MSTGLASILLGVTASVVILAILESRTSHVWRARWASRGILGPVHTRPWTAARAIAPILAATAASWAYASPAAGVTAATVTWLAILAASLDLASCKIPREACWAILGIGATAVIADMNLARFASFALSLLMTVLSLGLVAFLTRGKLGSGDVRLMLAFTPLTAWTGYTTVFVAILAAAVLQLPLRAFLRRYALNMTGPGFPFAPALGLGMLIAVLLVGAPGVSEATWIGILPA